MKFKEQRSVGILDADILVYRSCFSSERYKKDVVKVFTQLLDTIKEDMGCNEYSLHLSGGGNFRKDMQQGFTQYKGNRKAKPKDYLKCREHILNNYDTISVPLYEADDTAAIMSTQLKKEGVFHILGTIDKDWNQIGGIIYNFNKKSIYTYSTNEAVDFFHKQLLIGDTVDCIPGIEGIGPIRANGLLDGLSLSEQFKTIVQQYKQFYAKDYIDRLNVMGTLLYLVKDYKEQWSIDFWKKYLRSING